jgi:general secretion pathway protein C
MRKTWWISAATFAVWLLASASVVYWALQFASSPAAPASAVVAAPRMAAVTVDSQALAQGLGAKAATPSEAVSPAQAVFDEGRFELYGVVVGRGRAVPSVALIAVDSQRARAYRIGESVIEGVVLHSVAAGRAMLAADLKAPVGLTLNLPENVSAVAGTALPSRPEILGEPQQLSEPAPSPQRRFRAEAQAMPLSGLGQRQP